MRFKVKVSREWTEYGEVEVDAADEDEARDIARDYLSSGDTDIDWDGNMDPGKDDVESVEELDE
jgi:hypothetical protein